MLHTLSFQSNGYIIGRDYGNRGDVNSARTSFTSEVHRVSVSHSSCSCLHPEAESSLLLFSLSTEETYDASRAACPP
jgi:hypothetical protein